MSRAISPGITPEAQPDDCVHVHTGNGINVVDGAEALEGLRLPQERVEGYWPEQLDLTTGDLQA